MPSHSYSRLMTLGQKPCSRNWSKTLYNHCKISLNCTEERWLLTKTRSTDLWRSKSNDNLIREHLQLRITSRSTPCTAIGPKPSGSIITMGSICNSARLRHRRRIYSINRPLPCRCRKSPSFECRHGTVPPTPTSARTPTVTIAST